MSKFYRVTISVDAGAKFLKLKFLGELEFKTAGRHSAKDKDGLPLRPENRIGIRHSRLKRMDEIGKPDPADTTGGDSMLGQSMAKTVAADNNAKEASNAAANAGGGGGGTGLMFGFGQFLPQVGEETEADVAREGVDSVASRAPIDSKLYGGPPVPPPSTEPRVRKTLRQILNEAQAAASRPKEEPKAAAAAGAGGKAGAAKSSSEDSEDEEEDDKKAKKKKAAGPAKKWPTVQAGKSWPPKKDAPAATKEDSDSGDEAATGVAAIRAKFNKK